MVVDKLGIEKFSVNFCLLFVHGYLQLFAGVDTCKQTERLSCHCGSWLFAAVRGCSRLFAAVRGCSRLLTIFVIKFIFSQSQTPINDLSYVCVLWKDGIAIVLLVLRDNMVIGSIWRVDLNHNDEKV